MTRIKLMLQKFILFLVLLCAGTALAADEIFEGKIEEISSKTSLTMDTAEKFLALKLDSKPGMEFRITATDAVKFGLIDAKGTPAVFAPGRVKGLGWQVRLTCDRQSVLGGEPLFFVKKLERLD